MHNDSTLSLLKDFNTLIGIIIEIKIADLVTDNPFIFPRMDIKNFFQ